MLDTKELTQLIVIIDEQIRIHDAISSNVNVYITKPTSYNIKDQTDKLFNLKSKLEKMKEGI